MIYTVKVRLTEVEALKYASLVAEKTSTTHKISKTQKETTRLRDLLGTVSKNRKLIERQISGKPFGYVGTEYYEPAFGRDFTHPGKMYAYVLFYKQQMISISKRIKRLKALVKTQSRSLSEIQTRIKTYETELYKKYK